MNLKFLLSKSLNLKALCRMSFPSGCTRWQSRLLASPMTWSCSFTMIQRSANATSWRLLGETRCSNLRTSPTATIAVCNKSNYSKWILTFQHPFLIFEKKKWKWVYAISMLSLYVSPYQLFNSWTNLCEIWYLHHHVSINVTRQQLGNNPLIVAR
jgi:hypothetical protein